MPAAIQRYRARRDWPFENPTALESCITIGERR
jgi:hypothetical protein